MCLGGKSSSYQSPVTPVQLTPPTQIVQAPQTLQGIPAPARPVDQLTFKKRGKRSLTIPQTSSVNIPGM